MTKRCARSLDGLGDLADERPPIVAEEPLDLVGGGRHQRLRPPRAVRPRRSAVSTRTASLAVKLLVASTQRSGPAPSGIASSARRQSVEPSTLTRAATRAPRACAACGGLDHVDRLAALGERRRTSERGAQEVGEVAELRSGHRR